MNIILFFTYGVTLQDWVKNGSLEREIKLYKKLSENKKIKFTFITFGNESDRKFQSYVGNINILPIYEKYKFHENKLLRFIYSFYIGLKLNKKFENIDLIKTNQLMGSWLAAMLKIKSKSPLIIRTGYNVFYFSLKNKKSISKKVIYFLLTQVGVLFSDLYFVSSNQEKDFMNKYFLFTKNKLQLRRNWIDTDTSFTLTENKLQDRILSVGRLEYQKNYEYLIKSFSKSSITIDIVGEGSQIEYLKKIANENNTKCNFIENMPHEELLKIMSQYHIFVLTSLFEGNPKALLESMAMGCIPVVSNIKNNQEIITDGKNGILIDVQSDKLKNIVEELLIDKKRLIEMSKYSKQSIHESYSLEKLVEIEYQDYLNLINS